MYLHALYDVKLAVSDRERAPRHHPVGGDHRTPQQEQFKQEDHAGADIDLRG